MDNSDQPLINDVVPLVNSDSTSEERLVEKEIIDAPLVSEQRKSSNGSENNRSRTPPPTLRGRQRSPDRGLRAGAISPSGVSNTRRHSPVIKTKKESNHELSKGREAVIIPPPAPFGNNNNLRATSNDSTPSKTSRLFSRRKNGGVERAKSEVVAVDTNLPQFLREPPTLRLDAWAETPGKSFSVRGPNYMDKGKKVNSDSSVFRLLTVDIVKVATPIMTGICSHPNERIQLALAREKATGIQELPNFIFCVNLVIPHTHCFHAAFYFGLDDIDILKDTSTPTGKVANEFFFGDSDEYRNETFKLIPRIVEGNYIVKKAVGSKPAILGKKIPQTYIRTSRYFEIICNIAAEKIAAGIVKLSLGYAKTLAVDMAFLLEGRDVSELPEQVLGAVRIINMDFKKRDGQRVIEAPF